MNVNHAAPWLVLCLLQLQVIHCCMLFFKWFKNKNKNKINFKTYNRYVWRKIQFWRKLDFLVTHFGNSCAYVLYKNMQTSCTIRKSENPRGIFGEFSYEWIYWGLYVYIVYYAHYLSLEITKILYAIKLYLEFLNGLSHYNAVT